MFLVIKVFMLRKVITSLSVAFFIFAAFATAPVVISVSKNNKNNETINWVDFNITYQALSDALEVDINSHDKKIQMDWVELLACLGAKYGGNFKMYKKSDLTKLVSDIENEGSLDKIANQYKNYNYFKEAYGAVLDGMVGEYEIESNDIDNNIDTKIEKRYGLKAFSPIAKGYSYSHYDDFGSSRSYGFRRKHLGHDLMGSIGTPVIAVESGIVENVGWNQYGGWRIGIRSFDKKRYHYYAHLRKDHPYNDIYEGKVIKAGDVIGYLGMTGYSTKENVNNINTPHLHYGLEIIFDEQRREEKYEIWVDVYAIVKLLEKNRSEVYKVENEYYRKKDIFFPETDE